MNKDNKDNIDNKISIDLKNINNNLVTKSVHSSKISTQLNSLDQILSPSSKKKVQIDTSRNT